MRLTLPLPLTLTRYEPRFQLWSCGVVAPAQAGITEEERAARLSDAIAW